jgi:hypothetical protein
LFTFAFYFKEEMRVHVPQDMDFSATLERAKVAFRKDRQRKNERAAAQRKAAQKEAADARQSGRL